MTPNAPQGVSEPKRYGTRTMNSGSTGEDYTVFDEEPGGEWVRYTDYRALASKVKELEAQHDDLCDRNQILRTRTDLPMTDPQKEKYRELEQKLADAQARYDELLQQWNEGYTAQVEQQHAALRERVEQQNKMIGELQRELREKNGYY